MNILTAKHYTGSDLGQDFRSFFTKERNRIAKKLTELGCKDLYISRQFYYYSGFFTSKTGQIYYFSISDMRHFPENQLLYRTATSYKDYSGGGNQYCNRNLSDMRLI